MTTLDPDTFFSADSPAGNFVRGQKWISFKATNATGGETHTAPAWRSDFLWRSDSYQKQKAEVRNHLGNTFGDGKIGKMSLVYMFFFSMQEFHVLDIYHVCFTCLFQFACLFFYIELLDIQNEDFR